MTANKGAAESTDDSRSGALPHGSIHALSKMMKDLEVQLDQMLAINGALEKDLENERARRIETKRKADDLAEQLIKAEWEAASKEDLLAEISHLKAERSQLSGATEKLKEELVSAERERDKYAKTVGRMRAGRSDALEEVQSVEAQFERAMEIVSDHKSRLTVLTEECDALRGRLKISADALVQTEEERDALISEVDESRVTLEDIRRSLVDACVVAQYRTGNEDDEQGESE